MPTSGLPGPTTFQQQGTVAQQFMGGMPTMPFLATSGPEATVGRMSMATPVLPVEPGLLPGATFFS